MATGKVQSPVSQVEILVNDSGQRRKEADTETPQRWTSWVGAYDGYILDINDVAVQSFSQVHIHRYGRLVELNIVMTVNGIMIPGTFYTLFRTPFTPIYTLRAEGYGAQGTADYMVQEGLISLPASGNISFTPYENIASGGTKTFRFNILYITA